MASLGAWTRDRISEEGMAMDVNDVLSTQGNMPRPTTLIHPNIVGSANAGLGAYVTDLTPQSLMERMPNIINSSPVAVDTGSDNPFADWVSENPLLAAGGLGLVAWLVLRK